MFERKIVPAATAGARDVGADVLRFLAQQRLPPTPAYYGLGYVVLSMPNGLAARAVDAVVMAGRRLSQAEADGILATHGHLPGKAEETDEELEAEDDARATIRRQALRLAELAADTVETTGRFGRELAEEQTALGSDGIAIAHIVATMVERAGATERQLAEAAHEIGKLRQEVEVARHDASRDALTGLDNRRGVYARMDALGERDDLIVAICDIDLFKAVNDRYGHVVGDRVLKLVAGSLSQSCAPHLVSRWGGEEFLVLLEGLDLDQATAVIEQARIDLAVREVKLRATDEPLGPITISAGVAALGTRPLERAIHEADTLLYRAKSEGRNQVAREAD